MSSEIDSGLTIVDNGKEKHACRVLSDISLYLVFGITAELTVKFCTGTGPCVPG